MNWINIHTDTLRDSIFIGSEPLERATWICLLGWSCTQENGGVIEDCKSWSDRRWQQTCGVTKQEIDNDSELYFFKGDDLHITYYPIDHENTVKIKREAGKKGGRPIHSKTKNHEVNHVDTQQDKQNITLKKDKVKKSNEKESKINGFQPPEYYQFESYLKETLPEINPDWTPSRIIGASKNQYNTYVENNWKDGNDKPIKNWKTKARNALLHHKPWNYGRDQDKPHTHQTYAELNAKAKSDQLSKNLQNPLF